MREQEVDAARLGGQVVLQHPPIGIGLLGFAKQPLEIGDVAVDGDAEIAFAAVSAGDLVEGGLSVQIVDVPSEDAALAGPEALPHLGRRAVIDGARDLIETELTARLLRRGRAPKPQAEALRLGLRGARQEIADRPLTPR